MSAFAHSRGGHERALALHSWAAHREPRPRLLLHGLHDRQRGHVLHEGQAHACACMCQPCTSQDLCRLSSFTCWTNTHALARHRYCERATKGYFLHRMGRAGGWARRHWRAPEMSSSLLTENMRQPMGELHRFCPRPARPRAGCIGLGSAAETFGHMLPCTHGLGLQADGDARSQCDQSHLHCPRQGSNGLLTRSPPTLRLCLNARPTQRQAGLSKGESHISWPCVWQPLLGERLHHASLDAMQSACRK